jgi:hypothetical protein
MGARPNRLAPQVGIPLTPAQRLETKPPNEVRREQTRITARDLRGLTPEDVSRAMTQQNQIDTLTERYESELGTNTRAANLTNLRRLERAEANAGERAKVMREAKLKAAEAIAKSNLSDTEKRARLDRLIEDNNLESVLEQTVNALGLPGAQDYGNDREAISRELFQKPYSQLEANQQARVNERLRQQPTNYGADREAVSQEFYNKPYSELNQTQRGVVNEELPKRTAPSLEVLRTEDGAFIIDKQTGTARQINPDGSAGPVYRRIGPQGELPQTQPTPPGATTPPPARTQSSTGRTNLRGQDALVNGLREMGKERALELYADAIASGAPITAKRAYREALIKAYPDLETQIPPVGGTPARTSEVLSDMESPLGEPVLAGERYAQATAVAPTRVTNLVAGQQDLELVARLRDLGRDRALLLYERTILPRENPEELRVYRAAMAAAYPELTEVLPALPVTEVTKPRAFGALAPPKPTENQEKALNFGTRAFKSNNILNLLEARGQYGRGVLLNNLERISRMTPAEGAAAGRTVGSAAGTVLGGAGGYIVGSILNFRAPFLPALTIAPGRALGAAVGGAVGAYGGGIIGSGLGAGSAFVADNVARWIRSEDDQAYFQAKLDFISAVLRKESGAAISDTEFKREEERYFPSDTDTANTIRQKARARATVIRGLEREGGKKIME